MNIYVTYLIQILLVIHVLKTGRNRYWVWILLFLPLLGGIAYLVIELLPEFTGSITGQKAMRGARAALDPGADLRHHAAAWQQSPNADNARRYAGALLDAGKHAEAEQVLDGALSGFFSTEPNLMLLRARARFENDDPRSAVKVLEELQEANPEFRSAEGHLLYARALENAGEGVRALEEFRAVANYYPGAEARYRMALALGKAGREKDARTEFGQMLNDADLAPRHFRKSQAIWLKKARAALKELE
ncbi:MAG: tetratricopeptide repeat protein [Xanthomonadales bacterium]|nr:tetratricopeptide repeat protein [Xanthomonadales bacterium]NIX13108.1 tetratricopeptide repeat protein [Xanthomonadales bacterium]